MVQAEYVQTSDINEVATNEEVWDLLIEILVGKDNEGTRKEKLALVSEEVRVDYAEESEWRHKMLVRLRLNNPDRFNAVFAKKFKRHPLVQGFSTALV